MTDRRRPLAAVLVTTLLAGALTLGASPAGAVAPANGTVFINELH